MVGLLSVVTGGSKRITLAEGVDAGVAVGVGLTGHVLAVGVTVGANGSSTPAGASPLCASTKIGRRKIPDSAIRHSQTDFQLFVANSTN